MTPSTDTLLFDFSRPDAARRWRTVNDDVMGGVSTSRFAPTDHGTAVFEGTISLDHGGGFATVRGPIVPFDLSRFEGLAVHLRGDGRHYAVNLFLADPAGALSYRRRFATTVDEWQTVHAAFQDLTPTFRGRPVPDAPSFDAGRVQAVGLLIGGQQAGPFRLEIAWIAALAGPAPGSRSSQPTSYS